MSAKFKSYRPENKTRTFFSRMVSVLFILFLLRLIFSQFLVQSYLTTSDSMAPDIPKGARVIASPLENRFAKIKKSTFNPKRGSIYMVEPEFYIEPALWIRILDPAIRFVTLEQYSLFNHLNQDWNAPLQMKRVVGLPGDTLYMEDFILFIKAAGEEFFLSEFELSPKEYEIRTDPLPEGVKKDFPFTGNMEEFTLGEDQFFMMGDYRSATADSRVWGPVPRAQLKSRVLFKFWPLFGFGK